MSRRGTPLHAETRVAALLVLLTALLGWNCFKDPITPTLPRWDANLTIPIADRTLLITDVVSADSALLRPGGANQLVYATSAPARSIEVGDRISLTPGSVSESVRLGRFHVALQPMNVSILGSLPGVPTGTPTIVAPSPVLSVPDVDFSPTTWGGTLSFASGDVSLTIRNNLPVPLAIVDTIRLLGPDGTGDARFFFPLPISPKGSMTSTDHLDNTTLGTGMRLTGIVVQTPGSGPSQVVLPADSAIVASVTTSGLQASGATAPMVTQQRLIDNDETTFPFQDSTRLQQADLSRGTLNFSFVNMINLDLRCVFRIRELLRPAGGGYIAYQDSVTLPANGQASYSLNLAGCRLQSQTGELIQTMQLVTSLVVPSTVNRTVAVHDTDRIVITMSTPSPIIVDSAIALLHPTWVDFGSSIPINFGKLPAKFSGQLNIPSASLRLNLQSTIGFQADVYAQLAGVRGPGDTVFLRVPAAQQRLSPGPNTILFDNSEVGKFLSSLSTKLPDSIRLVGRVLVNPPDVYATPAGIGRFSRTSAVTGTMSLQVPMNLGITAGTYIDTAEFEGKQEDKDRLNDMTGGKICLQIENTLPVELSLSLTLLDDARRPLLQIPQNGTPVRLPAAQVDAQGNVSASALSSTAIVLSQPEIRRFITSSHVSYTIGLATSTGATTVTFLSTDFVHVKAWSEFGYKVSP